MHIPLYEQIRPQNLSEIFGQDHLVAKNGYLTHIVNTQKPISLLLFGPPGCGKTTIARLYARAFDLPFRSLSGVLQSTSELKKLLKEGQETPLFHSQIILFVDEIHRFNRAQQDIFLPFLEDGSLILVGATTENPSFALNSALLSRLRVVSLHALDDSSLEKILSRFEEKKGPLALSDEARQWVIRLSQGDGRHLLNTVEILSDLPKDKLHSSEEISLLLQKRPALYDKDKEGHYNLISALHKSIRGSDPDASLYWFCRMLEGGEDPLFIGRRVIRAASEDIGLADPQAMSIALAAFQTYQLLGSPEGELALAEAIVYLALAPKSNAVYSAYQQAREEAGKTGHLNPPKNILNAPTRLMEQMGYGQGYIYEHDSPAGYSGQPFFPPELEKKTFYSPVERGFEREMKKRIEYFLKLRHRIH